MSVETIDLVAAEGADEDARSHPGGLLERVALTLGSTLELREALRLLAEMGREAIGADRCSVFLLDGRRLRPAVALGAERDEGLWEAFRAMGPVELVGERWERMLAGRALAFPDAADTDGLVPKEWVERFSLGALVLVPLASRGEPCGLMALDWSEPGAIPHDDLAVLDALGTYAGVAVANARLYEAQQRRIRLQEALVEGADALASVLEPAELAGRLADAYLGLVDARLCGVGLLDAQRSRVTTLVVRGAREMEAPLRLDELPPRLVAEAWQAWEHDQHPLRLRDEPFFDDTLGGCEAGASWYLLVPLAVDDYTRGVVLLGFEEGRDLDGSEHAAIDALGGLAAAALDRRLLVDSLARRYEQLDTLFRASVALTSGADDRALVDELDRLLAPQGIEVRGLALRDRRLKRHLGGDEATDEERAAWRGGRWAPGGDWLALPGGLSAVPMRLGGRLVGTLRVAAGDLDADDRAFVEALARGLAEVADRDCLRAKVDEAARERAVTAERERMAADLHATAGQALVAIGLIARQHAEDLGANSPTGEVMLRLGALADDGKEEIDGAVRALSFMPAPERGLLAAVRALSRSVAADSGVEVSVEPHGRPERLAAEVERALYWVAHEALANAWRHARCRSVRVELDFGGDTVGLRIVDDGDGLGGEPLEEHAGIAGMRRAVRQVDGHLEVREADPHGTAVEARVERRVR